MSSYSILTSISQYDAEDNLLFSDGKSQRKMILMIIMSDNTRHGEKQRNWRCWAIRFLNLLQHKEKCFFQEKNIKWIPTLLFWAMQGNVPSNSSWLLAC